jgi:DUF917 family protein
VGATSVSLEKLPSGTELSTAIQAIARWTDTNVSAVMPMEAGGANGIAALIAAGNLGLPLLDLDLMGRALPRLDQLAWAAQGLPLNPCAICDSNGRLIVIDGTSAGDLERVARAFLTQTGGWAAFALRPTPVECAASTSIAGSLTRALQLGRAHSVLSDRASTQELQDALGCRVLGAGRVRDIARHRSDATKCAIHVEEVRSGAVMRIEAQNEYLLAFVDGELMASTPDIVCLLDQRTNAPIAVDRVRVADDVTVLTLPGPPWWCEGDRIRFVGPEAFGLDAGEPPGTVG